MALEVGARQKEAAWLFAAEGGGRAVDAPGLEVRHRLDIAEKDGVFGPRRRQTACMSWLEDFSDGEAVWKRLVAAPTFRTFLRQVDQLSNYERDKVILYHAIRERQAAGDWMDWVGESAK